jgi:L-cystine transport system permease protein
LFFVIAAYSLNEAAFLGEIIRGSILAVPKLQTEAGYSTGMNYAQTFLHIIFPQAIRVAIPSFGVDLVGLFQSTSLAFLLGAVDVIGRARIIGSNTGHSLDVYVDAAIIFIVISVLMELIFHLIQKKGDKIYDGRE